MDGRHTGAKDPISDSVRWVSASAHWPSSGASWPAAFHQGKLLCSAVPHLPG